MERKVFISYASVDQDFARTLANDLRAAGIDVWMDKSDIRTGDHWDKAVERALLDSAAVVAILTPSSVERSAVLDELAFATTRRVPVLPVLASTCDPPIQVQRLQYADFRTSYPSGLKQLLTAFESIESDRAAELLSSKEPAAVFEAVAMRQRLSSHLNKPRPLTGALWGGAGGTLYGGIVAWILYGVDMPSQQGLGLPHLFNMAAGAICAGALWSLAGAIIAMRWRPLTWSISSAAVGAALWILAAGSASVDTLYTAYFVASPCMAIAGAAANLIFSRWRVSRRLRRLAK